MLYHPTTRKLRPVPYSYPPPGEAFAASPVQGPGEAIEAPSDVLPGSVVYVAAYGRWRPGEVVKRGRSRVVVEYVRNGQGETDERAFPVREVRKVAGDAR